MIVDQFKGFRIQIEQTQGVLARFHARSSSDILSYKVEHHVLALIFPEESRKALHVARVDHRDQFERVFGIFASCVGTQSVHKFERCNSGQKILRSLHEREHSNFLLIEQLLQQRRVNSVLLVGK